MESSLIRRIEQIAKNELIALNYPITYNGEAKKLSRLRMLFYQIKDGAHLLLFNIKTYGLIKGLTFQWMYFRCSGNT